MLAAERKANAPLEQTACEVFCWIEDYMAETGGVTPSFSEIMAGTGLRRTTVHRAVAELERLGELARIPGMQQAIVILQPTRHLVVPQPTLAEIYAACIARDGPPRRIA